MRRTRVLSERSANVSTSLGARDAPEPTTKYGSKVVRGRAHRRRRAKLGVAPAVVLGCLAIVCSSLATGSVPASASGTGVTAVGPVLTADESPTLTIQRDGGMSVALPNGNALWIFGDTPTSRFEHGAWILRGWVGGSSAAEGTYTKGQAPAGMPEVNIGRSLATTNHPAAFIPAASNINLPDGSGKPCTPANGAVESGRWPTGAVLMPDNVNVLVTYDAVCDAAAGDYHQDGWGFLEYNWMTNTISAGPDDVFPPAVDGSSLPSQSVFLSPIVLGNQLILFSKTSTNVYATTINQPDLATLEQPSSYSPQVIQGLPVPLGLNVTAETSPEPKLQLLEQTDLNGGFAVLSAPSPAGPWSAETSGALPGCTGTADGIRCTEYYGHPELSTASQLVMSYYQPGYGPGVPGNPDPTLFHLAVASIALTPNPTTLTVMSSSLPRAAPGQAYTTNLVATGGTPNATWSIASGSLPPGLALQPTSGVISGIPSQAGIYGFTVVATDATARTDSAALWIIVGATPPSRPTAVRAASRASASTTGSLSVQYVPGSNNGAAVTKYTAMCTSANGGATGSGVHKGATPAPITVSGVTTAKSYTCKVSATNAQGTGSASVASARVTVGAPAAPKKVNAVHEAAGSVKVTFTPGADNGAAVTKYTAQCRPSHGGVANGKSGTTHSIVVAGLTSGRTYTCTVTATNRRGTGPATSSSAVVA